MRFPSRLLFLALALLTVMGLRAQSGKPVVEGNGKLITKDFPVSSFSSLEASGLFELHLAQGGAESVKVEAEENLMEYFTVRNEGARLVVDMERMKNVNLRTKQKMRVWVSFKTLGEIQLRTIGAVRSDGPLTFGQLQLDNKSIGDVQLELKADRLNLKNHSVGNLRLKGSADEADVENHSVGGLEAGDFVVQIMSIDNNGVGNAEVNAARELKVKEAWLSKVRNRGSGQVRKMETRRI